jgi:hypothetical protein
MYGVTRDERDDFWQRFYEAIDRFREDASDCSVAVNKFENRQWDVKFTRRRAGEHPASVTLAIAEHAASKEQLLLAVTPACTVGGVDATGERDLIPVFFDEASKTFCLQADHGPVWESHLCDFFAHRAGAILSRL